VRFIRGRSDEACVIGRFEEGDGRRGGIVPCRDTKRVCGRRCTRGVAVIWGGGTCDQDRVTCGRAMWSGVDSPEKRRRG